MKNHLLAAAAALTLLASCTKEYNTINAGGEPARPAFRVSGVTDVTFEKLPFGAPPRAIMPLQVVYIHGESQRVTLQLSGIPQGIEDSLQTTSGYPDFSTSAVFLYKNAVSGNYPAKLSAKADTGKTQEYNFNINVIGDTSCSGYLSSGGYETVSSCDPTGGAYPTTMSPNGRKGDTLYVNNFQKDNTALMCLVDCRAGNVFIPLQPIGTDTYFGAGSVFLFFNGGLGLSLTVRRQNSSGTLLSDCTYTLTKK